MRHTDPELKYCPRCDEEYREDFKICASCDVDLISGRDKIAAEETAKAKLTSRSMDIGPDDEVANIRKGPLGEMKQLQVLLAANTIPALVAGEKGSCGKGCCGTEFYLQIKVSDGQDATDVLAREFTRTTALDSHDLSTAYAVFDTGAEASTCPACGTKFSTSQSTCPDCGLCF
jgi:hypothetical protein